MSISPLRWFFRQLFPTLYILARARRLYRIRHERLLREHEREFLVFAETAGCSNWTPDDIIQLASLTVSSVLQAKSRHVRAVKAARVAKQNARKRKEEAKK